MSSYGGYNAYPPTMGLYGNQQLITNYPASNYYNAGMMGGYGGGYYPNATGYMGYGGYGGYGGGMYGGYGGAYGGAYGGYLPYKQSTFRSIYNRLRHGTSYPYYGSGYPYEYGRHRGSWIDYQ